MTSIFSRAPAVGKDHRLARYDHIIVHCLATPPHINGDAAWVDRVHREKGFVMCGYHGIVTREAEFQDADGGFRARPLGQAGAHVGDCGPGWNGRSLGIALAGGVDAKQKIVNNFTDRQMGVLEDVLYRIYSIHPTPESVTLLGHRDLIKLTNAPPKACPCFDVQPWYENVGGYFNSCRLPPGGMPSIVPEKGEANPFYSSPMAMPQYHVVAKGDTLSRISTLYGVTLAEIMRLNPGLVPEKIQIKQKVMLR